MKIFLPALNIEFEKDEPAFRSCFECNKEHEHLKFTKHVHLCKNCDRFWINGYFFSAFDRTEDFLEFMKICVKKGCFIKIMNEKGDEIGY